MSTSSHSQLPAQSIEESKQKIELEEMPITKHLMILRQHLFKIVGILLLLFFCLFPFAIFFFLFFSDPLRVQLPVSSAMIATDVTATFIEPFKLNFFVGLMLAIPFIIYQI